MNNDDLEAIEKEIAERKAQAVATVEQKPVAPVIQFDKPAEKQGQTSATDTADELVKNAFGQAVVHNVSTDESVQADLLVGAKKVIKNKTNAIKERADLEDKEAYFNNRKGACDCFGYDEMTTEKWAVQVMNFWHNVMTAIWLLIGFFTFAPITFVAKKIKVIFKKSWAAVTIAIAIYVLVVGVPILLGLLKK